MYLLTTFKTSMPSVTQLRDHYQATYISQDIEAIYKTVMNFNLIHPSQIDVIILSTEKILRTVLTDRSLPSSQTDHWVMHMQDRSHYHCKVFEN